MNKFFSKEEVEPKIKIASFLTQKKEEPKIKLPKLFQPKEEPPIIQINVNEAALEETALIIKDKAEEIYSSVKNGNGSIRWVALICGALLVLNSFGGFFVEFFVHGDLTHAVLEIYAFVLGVFALAMESDQEAFPYARRLRFFLGKYLGMVRTVTGRGIFYIIAGSLALMSDSLWSKTIGGSLIIVGILYIYLGRVAADKVKKLRTKKFPEMVIKAKFRQYASDGEYLTFDEFHVLLNSLSVDLNVREAELIYVSLDKSLDRGLSFEEFKTFWETNDELPPPV